MNGVPMILQRSIFGAALGAICVLGAVSVATGNGDPLCFGCHTAGNDYVLSEFPLR